MRHGNGTDANVSLQELFANADAATPFDTEAHSNEGSLLVNACLGGRAGEILVHRSPYMGVEEVGRGERQVHNRGAPQNNQAKGTRFP